MQGCSIRPHQFGLTLDFIADLCTIVEINTSLMVISLSSKSCDISLSMVAVFAETHLGLSALLRKYSSNAFKHGDNGMSHGRRRSIAIGRQSILQSCNRSTVQTSISQGLSSLAPQGNVLAHSGKSGEKRACDDTAVDKDAGIWKYAEPSRIVKLGPVDFSGLRRSRDRSIENIDHPKRREVSWAEGYNVV